MRRSGFTLIELVVVLFFIVVGAAMALPRFSAFQRSGQAHDAARRVAALVRGARELAIERQRPIAIQMGSSPRAIGMAYDDTLLPPITADANGSNAPMGSTNSPIGSANPNMPGGMNGAGQAPTGGDPGDLALPSPLFLPEPLMAAIQVDGTSESASAPGATGGLTIMPDGRAPDADIVIQYAPDRALRVTVRHQATQVQIDNGGEAAPSPLGAVP